MIENQLKCHWKLIDEVVKKRAEIILSYKIQDHEGKAGHSATKQTQRFSEAML